jgi:hypothetical protein
MTKQLNLRSSINDAAASKRRPGVIYVVIILIAVVFAGKQCFDVAQEWERTSMQSSDQIEAKTELCLKEYNEKMCGQGSAPAKCKELLACIHQKGQIEYGYIFTLASQELNNDFWLPATLMGLLMLFKVTESLAQNPKFSET